jgi:hypothetical protein
MLKRPLTQAAHVLTLKGPTVQMKNTNLLTCRNRKIWVDINQNTLIRLDSEKTICMSPLSLLELRGLSRGVIQV